VRVALLGGPQQRQHRILAGIVHDPDSLNLPGWLPAEIFHEFQGRVRPNLAQA
jgi:hypothetical protein